MQEINNNLGTFVFLLFAGTLLFAAVVALFGSAGDIKDLINKKK